MQTLKKTAAVWIALVLLCPLCTAAGTQEEAFGLSEVEESAREYLEGTPVRRDAQLGENLRALGQVLRERFTGSWREAVRSGVKVLCVVFACAFAAELGTAGQGTSVRIVGALALTGTAAGSIYALIGLGRESITAMHNFARVLLPTVTAAAAASGSPTAAAARQMATVLFSNLLLRALDSVLLPLIYLYLAACTAAAAVGNAGLKRIASGIRWTVVTLLTGGVIAFVGYLTLSGVIAGSADAAAIRAAKFAVSSAVPVVGKVIADASETLLAGAGAIRSAVGVFGMLCVLGACITPFLRLALHYLSYKIVSAVAATVSDGPLSGLIDQIGDAFGLVLAMTGTSAFVLLISLMITITSFAG